MPTAELPFDDLPIDTPRAFESAGLKMVLLRTRERVFAYEDVCPHAFWPLSAGSFHNGFLECPGHAWEFQIETGKCQDSPGYCLSPISVSVEAGVVKLAWEASKNPAASPEPLATRAEQRLLNVS